MGVKSSTAGSLTFDAKLTEPAKIFSVAAVSELFTKSTFVILFWEDSADSFLWASGRRSWRQYGKRMNLVPSYLALLWFVIALSTSKENQQL
jgi:hypothetical protein